MSVHLRLHLPICRHEWAEIEPGTTGAPVKIVMTADRPEIAADGEDLAIIRVETLDRDGRRVPVADNLIRFKVSGEGLLIGVGNGDPNPRSNGASAFQHQEEHAQTRLHGDCRRVIYWIASLLIASWAPNSTRRLPRKVSTTAGERIFQGLLQERIGRIASQRLAHLSDAFFPSSELE